MFGRDALRTLWMTKPSYVPWKTQSPWKARSELTTFDPVPDSGTGFSEIPSALRFFEISQSATTSRTGGGAADDGAAVKPTASTASATKRRVLISLIPLVDCHEPRRGRPPCR